MGGSAFPAELWKRQVTSAVFGLTGMGLRYLLKWIH